LAGLTELGPPVLRKTLSLVLPAVIPSWRFFKTVAPSPRVECRVKLGGGAFSNWSERFPLPDYVSLWQMLGRMLWNPDRNAQLYLVSLSERLVETGSDHAANELARRVAQALPADVTTYQFRLVCVQRQDGQLLRFVEYESDVLEAGAI
jgi:hypothetical protein